MLVSLMNFHGIELEDFACCVARTALWIAEKQADADTAKVTQRVYQELPLTDYEASSMPTPSASIGTTSSRLMGSTTSSETRRSWVRPCSQKNNRMMFPRCSMG